MSTAYDTRHDKRGLSVPAGETGLYGHSDVTLNEGITLDGQLVPFMALSTVETGVGEPHVGVVTAPSDVYEVTLTVPTDAQDANDVIAATQEMKNCARVPGGTGVLQSAILLDPDDQGVAIDLYILSANVALGTEDAAITITDADAEKILAVIPIATTDYKDLSNSQVAHLSSLGRVIKAAAGTRSLWIAATTAGTPTFGGGELKVKLGFLWD